MKRCLINLLTLLSLLLCIVVMALWVTGGLWVGALPLPGGAPSARYFAVASGGGTYFLRQEVTLPADGSWVARVLAPSKAAVQIGDTVVATVEVSQAFLPHPAFGRFDFSPNVIAPRMTFPTPSGGIGVCTLTSRYVVVPHWAPAIGFSVMPRLWLWSRRRRRCVQARAAAGLCLRHARSLPRVRTHPGRSDPVKRRLLNLLTLLSLLLCVAVVWLTWCPPGRGAHSFHRTAGGTYYSVSLYPGAVAFERSTRTIAMGAAGQGPPPDAGIYGAARRAGQR